MSHFSDDKSSDHSTSITALALEAAQLGAWQVTSAGTVIWDKRTRELHGVALTVTVTPEDTATFVHPEDRAALEAAVAQAAAPGGPGYYEAEYRVNSDAAGTRWLAVFARVMMDGERVTGFRGVVKDVTAHKLTEDLRELLLHELNHRTKNLMSVILSLARKTLPSAGVKVGALKAFEERLRALGRSQTALVAADGHFRADIHEVVTQAITPFAARGSDCIRISGPNVDLKAEQVMTLSLVLHELLTNAVKYGALSNADGIVELHWKIAHARGAVEFGWLEYGGPSVKPCEVPGFGTELITGLLNHQAGAPQNVQIEYCPTGVQFEFRLPCSDVSM